MTSIKMPNTLSNGKNGNASPESILRILKLINVHIYNTSDSEVCRLAMKPDVLKYTTRNLFALSKGNNIENDKIISQADESENLPRNPIDVARSRLESVATYFKSVQRAFGSFDRDVLMDFEYILGVFEKNKSLRDMFKEIKDEYIKNIHSIIPDVNDFSDIDTFEPEIIYPLTEILDALLVFTRIYFTNFIKEFSEKKGLLSEFSEKLNILRDNDEFRNIINNLTSNDGQKIVEVITDFEHPFYNILVVSKLRGIILSFANLISNLKKKFSSEKKPPSAQTLNERLKILVELGKILEKNADLQSFTKQYEEIASSTDIVHQILRKSISIKDLKTYTDQKFQDFHENFVKKVKSEGWYVENQIKAIRDKNHETFLMRIVKEYRKSFDELYKSGSEQYKNSKNKDNFKRITADMFLGKLSFVPVAFCLRLKNDAEYGLEQLRADFGQFFDHLQRWAIQRRAQRDDPVRGYILNRFEIVPRETLQKNCNDAGLEFLDPEGNPFVSISNPIKKKEKFKEKLNVGPEHISILNQIQDIVCDITRHDPVFTVDSSEFGESSICDYIIIHNGSFKKGAFFKYTDDSFLTLEVYDTSNGAFEKIEFKQNSAKVNPEYIKRRKELPDLVFIEEFRFVGSLKRPTYIIQASKQVDYSTNFIKMNFTPYDSSENSVPDTQGDIETATKNIIDHCYAYKMRRHGRLFCVFYRAHMDELLACDLFNNCFTIRSGRRALREDQDLDPYICEALRYGFDMTKIRTNQNQNDIFDYNASVHSPNTFVTMSVVCPDDIFYDNKLDIPYDVRINMSNIWPYMPILGLHHKHETETILPDETKGRKETKSSKIDRIWVRKLVDIYGNNGNSRSLEVFDGNNDKVVFHKTQNRLSNTFSISLYCASKEDFGLEVVTMDNQNIFDIAEILNKNRRISWNQYTIDNSEKLVDYIIESSTNKYFKELAREPLGSESLRKNSTQYNFTKEMIPRIANTIYAKMKTYKTGFPAEKFPKYQDLTSAMNASKFKHFEFLRTDRTIKKYDSQKNIESFNKKIEGKDFNLGGKVLSVNIVKTKNDKEIQELVVDIQADKIKRKIFLKDQEQITKYYNIIANMIKSGSSTGGIRSFIETPPGDDISLTKARKVVIRDGLKFAILNYLISGENDASSVSLSDIADLVKSVDSINTTLTNDPFMWTSKGLEILSKNDKIIIIDTVMINDNGLSSRTEMDMKQTHNLEVTYIDEIIADPYYNGYLNNIDMTFITILDRILFGDEKTLMRHLFNNYNNSDVPIGQNVADFLHRNFKREDFSPKQYDQIYHLLCISGNENSILTGDVPLKPKSEDRPITIIVSNIDWE